MNLQRGPTPCKHFDVCGRPVEIDTSGREGYCILHHPSTLGKNLEAFQQALNAHLEAGRCSFRHFRFPDGMQDANLSGRSFANETDFTDIALARYLQLDSSTAIEGGCHPGSSFVRRDGRQESNHIDTYRLFRRVRSG